MCIRAALCMGPPSTLPEAAVLGKRSVRQDGWSHTSTTHANHKACVKQYTAWATTSGAGRLPAPPNKCRDQHSKCSMQRHLRLGQPINDRTARWRGALPPAAAPRSHAPAAPSTCYSVLQHAGAVSSTHSTQTCCCHTHPSRQQPPQLPPQLPPQSEVLLVLVLHHWSPVCWHLWRLQLELGQVGV